MRERERSSGAKRVQFWCLPKLCLAPTKSGPFWTKMNQFEVLCANLNCSDPYCFEMTQNCVSPSQNEALQCKTIQRTPERSSASQCATLCDRERHQSCRVARATFWGAKPITGMWRLRGKTRKQFKETRGSGMRTRIFACTSRRSGLVSNAAAPSRVCGRRMRRERPNHSQARTARFFATAATTGSDAAERRETRGPTSIAELRRRQRSDPTRPRRSGARWGVPSLWAVCSDAWICTRRRLSDHRGSFHRRMSRPMAAAEALQGCAGAIANSVKGIKDDSWRGCSRN